MNKKNLNEKLCQKYCISAEFNQKCSMLIKLLKINVQIMKQTKFSKIIVLQFKIYTKILYSTN